MTDRQETIADIIAWLRKPREGENAYLTLWRDEIADRLEAAWKRERELTKPAENVNSGEASDTAGNCAKLRVALETLRELLGDLLRLEEAEYHNDFLNFCDIIDAAISAPPRNCDVGTEQEQAERYVRYCDMFTRDGMHCETCPCCGKIPFGKCEFAWAQMPYDEGGVK